MSELKKINRRQEKFCQLYVMSELFGNGVQSYAEAYKKDIETKENYNSCRVLASKLLTKVNIKNRIDELLKLNFNNEVVDNELSKLMLQNIDLNVKVSAIKEFNKLKQRITEHSEIKVELPQPIYTLKELKEDTIPQLENKEAIEASN